MQNPFSKDQMKNYLLLYGAIVVIMVLFYILNSQLNTERSHEKKVFETNTSVMKDEIAEKPAEATEENNSLKNRIQLLDKAY